MTKLSEKDSDAKCPIPLPIISTLLHLPYQPNLPITGICIDSRKIQPGNLFIAIRGERFDGHDFIADAIARGAVAVIANQAIPSKSVVQYIVPDSLTALTTLAIAYRKTLSCAVIALTGSNGKTTVKEMIAAILPQPAFATPGNLNNHIGVPLSVLQLLPQHQYAVFELGASHIGEIKHTVAIVQPAVTLINNIAPAHIGEFGSLEGVAHAKGEIHQGLAANGTAIINSDDAYADFWLPLVQDRKIVRFSQVKAVEVYAHHLTFTANGCAHFILVTPQGKQAVQLQVPGKHQVSNALAAAAATHALGIELSHIADGLNQFMGVVGRLTFRPGKNSAVIIDDSYNANARSVLTALDVLANHKGRRILVLGDMGELGAWTKQHHEEIGLAARNYGIEQVMTCGNQSAFTSQSFGEGGQHFQSQAELLNTLLAQLDKETTVLVKGSRSAAMEKIVYQLIHFDDNMA